MQKISQVISSLIYLVFFLTINVAHSEHGHDEYFVSAGVKIFYQDSGGVEAQTIILMHGYAMDHRMWLESGIYDSLANTHRVIAVDMRGHGKSDKPLLPSDYGPRVGLDIINLLDHLNVEKAHLVGFSMGAYVTARLAITHPDRVTSAALCSGGFPIQNEHEKEFQVATAKHMEEQGSTALASIALGWSLDGVTKEQVMNIKVPMLAVFGSEEINQTTQQQINLLKLVESSPTTIIIEGADHDSQNAAVLHPKFLAALEGFISPK